MTFFLLLQGFIVDDKDKATHVILSAPPAQQNDGKLSYYYWNSKDKNVIITKSLVEKYK